MKTSEQEKRLLSAVASAISVIAFVLYNWANLAGVTHPNASSWTIWAFITVLNFTSYKSLTGDWVKSMLPTVDSVMCILTALLTYRIGTFESLSMIDWYCLILGMIAGLCWWIFRSAGFAQVILQTALVIGFIPTFVGVMRDSSIEPWLPWLLWTVTFAIQFVMIKLTRSGKSQLEFLYPIVAVIFHGAIFVFAL